MVFLQREREREGEREREKGRKGERGGEERERGGRDGRGERGGGERERERERESNHCHNITLYNNPHMPDFNTIYTCSPNKPANVGNTYPVISDNRYL